VQDGAITILPHITKRIVQLDKLAHFKHLVINKHVDLDTLEDLELKAKFDELTIGCFLATIKVGDKHDAIVMHKFDKAVTLMVSQEHIKGFLMKYFTDEERDAYLKSM